MEGLKLNTGMSQEQILQNKADALNKDLPGEERQKDETVTCYDCDICKGKLRIYYVYENDVTFKPCICIHIRSSILRAKNSGLGAELSRCKFSTYVATNDWQKDVKQRAKQFADNPEGWLYVCGQVGGGKTHICTAVVGKLIHVGNSVRYMSWKDDATELKAKVNEPEYQNLISKFLNVDVLYIDDFLKMPKEQFRASRQPSVGDLNLAFQLINNRYLENKTTIISSEHNIDSLISFDEAVGSRIYERCKHNCIIIPTNETNNYRLR